MIRAIHFSNTKDLREKRPSGGVHFTGPDENGEAYLWYVCPCGCGVLGSILVGVNHKPADGPSWRWNGSTTEPNLDPSVHHVDHWHGWLRDGYWESC